MKKLFKEKENIILLLSAICFVSGLVLSLVNQEDKFTWINISNFNNFGILSFISTVFYLIGVILLYPDLIKNFFKEVKEKNFFNESLLMIIASVGAIILSEFLEAQLVLLLRVISELIEDKAKDKAKDSLRNTLNSLKINAHKVDKDSIIDINPELLEINDIIEVRIGESIPIDGQLISNEAYLDMSSLTGESKLLFLNKSKNVISGSIVKEKIIKVKVTTKFENSTFTKLINLINTQDKNKSKSEKFINKFSKYYTPFILITSILVFIIGASINQFNIESLKNYIYKALSILLIGCPCSLIISIPLVFLSSIHSSSKLGILIKGSSHIENIAKSKTFAFDKTGTLTKGDFKLLNKKEIDKKYLQIIASLESKSNHPISKALIKEYNGPILNVDNYLEIFGLGIKGEIDKKVYYIGNKKLVKQILNKDVEEDFYTTIFLFNSSKVLCKLIIDDQIKDEAKECIQNLKNEGVNKILIISGDCQNKVKRTAEYLNIDKYYYNLLPEEKLEIIKENNFITYIGDGINDAPSLIASTVGISIGKISSDIATSSSDIIICNDSLSKIVELKRLSKYTMKKIFFGVGLAILFKLIIFALLISNLLTNYLMLLSSIADTGTLIILIIYALFTLKYKPKYIN